MNKNKALQQTAKAKDKMIAGVTIPTTAAKRT